MLLEASTSIDFAISLFFILRLLALAAANAAMPPPPKPSPSSCMTLLRRFTSAVVIATFALYSVSTPSVLLFEFRALAADAAKAAIPPLPLSSSTLLVLRLRAAAAANAAIPPPPILPMLSLLVVF